MEGALRGTLRLPPDGDAVGTGPGGPELRTEVHGWAIQDHLLRSCFPTTLAGGTPVLAVGGDAVVARGFGLIDVDSSAQLYARQPGGRLVWAQHHAGSCRGGRGRPLLSPPLYRRGRGGRPGGRRGRPLGVPLVVALVQKGVTATCSEADHNRDWGLEGDSNLPDFRFAVGGPAQNPFVAQVLQAAGPAYRAVF